MAIHEAALVEVGKRTSRDGVEVANRILLAIPAAEYLRVRPQMEHVTLARHYLLHEPDAEDPFLYFPNSGLLSLVVVAENGRTVEAGIAGKEGIVGLASAVGLNDNPIREVVQISGDGFKVKADLFQQVFRSAPGLQIAFSRYAVLYGLQVSQTAACNRLHNAEQRLARWLLMTQDRIDSPLLAITHDFLATMLGTDRPTISITAAHLQKKQMIQYSRGSVRILNRKRLERVACECYGVVQKMNGDLGLE